jgi:hypothetical protein
MFASLVVDLRINQVVDPKKVLGQLFRKTLFHSRVYAANLLVNMLFQNYINFEAFLA